MSDVAVARKGQLNALAGILSADRVLTDDSTLTAYATDRTNMQCGAPLAIVFPKTTEEVQAIVRWANAEAVAIVPSGGRTGLSGGAVAQGGEIILSLDKMNRILDFSPEDRTLRCEAGVVLQTVQDYAKEQGLLYPVDYASAGSAQIGGSVATNAGGIKVIRYGMTRDWVAGLQVVTGAGDILELNHGLVKNNTGLDLRHLFVGSEGVLGIITQVTLRLTQVPEPSSVMVLGVPEFKAIMPVLQAFRERLELTAFECFSHNGMEKVMAHSGLQAPFDTQAPFYVLIEFESDQEKEREEDQAALTLFEYCAEQGWVLDGTLSQNLGQAEKLWRLREDLSETVAHWSPYKNDVSVPVSRMADFVVAIEQLMGEAYPDFEIVWWGHIGDGNLHINILKPEDMERETFAESCHQVSGKVFELVRQHGGSISAEHGIGLLKKDFLGYSRSVEEIELMRGIKQVFDPNKVMNPGKIFDL